MSQRTAVRILPLPPVSHAAEGFRVCDGNAPATVPTPETQKDTR